MMQWRDKPRDLDLHLLSFNCNTSALVTHCFFGEARKKLGLEHGECLFLDRDDTRVRSVMMLLCLPHVDLMSCHAMPHHATTSDRPRTLLYAQGNGCETLTLGQDGKGVASMNRQHAYVWMVHQFSKDDNESMSGEYMSVAFSGMINYVFRGDAAAKISGPQDARWWILAVAKFDQKAEEWRFDRVHKFLPTADTGCTHKPNVAAILPYIKQS
jgi:hypothetical protein